MSEVHWIEEVQCDTEFCIVHICIETPAGIPAVCMRAGTRQPPHRAERFEELVSFGKSLPPIPRRPVAQDAPWAVAAAFAPEKAALFSNCLVHKCDPCVVITDPPHPAYNLQPAALHDMPTGRRTVQDAVARPCLASGHERYRVPPQRLLNPQFPSVPIRSPSLSSCWCEDHVCKNDTFFRGADDIGVQAIRCAGGLFLRVQVMHSHGVNHIVVPGIE